MKMSRAVVRDLAAHLLRRHVADACPAPCPGSVRDAVGGCVPVAGSSARVSLARPKSRIFTRPSRVTKMFSGFRSRWTIPFSCAAASPRAICARTRWPCAPERRRPRAPRAASAPRGAPNDVGRALVGADVVDGGMFGWLRAAAARASCSKRRSRSASAENDAGSTLMATSRLSRVSRARYTSPMPPAPSGAASRTGRAASRSARAIRIAEVYAPVPAAGRADASRHGCENVSECGANKTARNSKVARKAGERNLAKNLGKREG